MFDMSPQQKIDALAEGGAASGYEDAYFMCVDMGEFSEDDDLLADAKRKDENRSIQRTAGGRDPAYPAGFHDGRC